MYLFERQNVSGSFYAITLELNVFGQYHTADQQLDWGSFGISAYPDAELDFLLDFEVEEIPALMGLAKLFYLVPDIFDW